MRSRNRFVRQFIHRARQPLRRPPSIHKDQRRRPPAHNLQQPRRNRLPNRSPLRPFVVAGRCSIRRSFAMSSTGKSHLQRQLLPRARIHHRHRPKRSAPRIPSFCPGPASVPRQKPRHLLQRPLRRRQPNPLHLAVPQSPPAAPATAPDAPRAWSAPAHESHPQSPSRPSAAPPPPPTSAADTATPAS